MEESTALTKLLNIIPQDPVSIISLFLLLFLYKWLCQPPIVARGKKLPPSPPLRLALPLIGHIHLLGALPHISLKSLSQRYGDLMLLYLGRKPTLIVSSAATASLIMKTHDSVFCSRPDSRFRLLKYNGKGIASAPYGKYWKHLRSICMVHVLSPQRVRSFERVRVEENANLVEGIKLKAATVTSDGVAPEMFNLSEMFNSLSNDIISRVAFGRKYRRDDQHDDGGNWLKLMKDYAELIGEIYIGDFVPALRWVNCLNGVNERSRRIMKELDELMEVIIEKHQLLDDNDQRRRMEDDHDRDEERTKDLVDVLIHVQKEDTTGIFDRESVKGVLLDMFTAGTDTSSTTLEWAMAELLRHPKVREKLQKEVREVLTMTTSSRKPTETTTTTITNDDLQKMVYLKAVIKETLRLHPPAALLVTRESIEDAEINGWFIPANTQVIINAWAIHRDPANWKDPDQFLPERFLDDCSIDYKGQHFEFIPFGSGRRSCPGMTFATTIIELVLATVMYKFDWSVPDAEKLDMTESFGIVVSRKLPLYVSATMVR